MLLIRRREGDPASDAVRRAILVDTATREMAIRSMDDLAEIELETVADAPVPSFGAPMTDPIFLVCTNGKRDACCALRGRALMTALATDHAERTWECTHLGGHRFAGNLVCLPDGIIYGRVSADDGPRLADAYLAGRLDPALLRGRSAWPAPAQVAEQELRLRPGLDGIDEVSPHGVEDATDGARQTSTLAAHRTARACAFELPAEPVVHRGRRAAVRTRSRSRSHWRRRQGCRA